MLLYLCGTKIWSFYQGEIGSRAYHRSSSKLHHLNQIWSKIWGQSWIWHHTVTFGMLSQQFGWLAERYVLGRDVYQVVFQCIISLSWFLCREKYILKSMLTLVNLNLNPSTFPLLRFYIQKHFFQKAGMLRGQHVKKPIKSKIVQTNTSFLCLGI